MSRLNMKALEAKIGYPPRLGYRAADIEEQLARNLDARRAADDWLVLNGIPRTAAAKAFASSVAKAYSNAAYLGQWRARVNPKWSAALEALDEVDDELLTEVPVVDPPTNRAEAEASPTINGIDTKLGELHGSQLEHLIARAAEAVIPPRLVHAEKRLAAQLDDKIKNAKLTLSDEAKESIRALAREAGRTEIERLMPPKRLEIVDTGRNITVDLGIQHELFPILLRAAQARNSDGNRLNILLSGPAGTGKTTAGRMIAKALSLPFGSDSSLDADYKVVGHNDVNGKPVRTEFWRIWTQGGVYVADEIDNWNASALTALNPAFGNGWITFPDGIAERHKDCIIIACANTWGLGATSDYVGRTRLDAASIDRLQPKIFWGTDEKLEMAIAKHEAGVEGEAWCRKVQEARRSAQRQGLKVLITPRATFTGIALMAQGFTEPEIIRMTITASLSPEQAKAIGFGGAS